MGTPELDDKNSGEVLVELRLKVPGDLFVAFQRCLWIRVHETGQKPLEIMREVVRDFLIKHEC